jgi:hypothetical protein
MKTSFTVTLIGFILTSCFSKQPEKTGFEGEILPSFNLIMIDSNRINTKDLEIGSSFVFVYYSPSCPYSKAQIAEITDNIELFKSSQFYFITPYPFQQMKSIYEEFELKNYSNIKMGCDSADSFGDHFKVQGFPYIAFYDKRKKLEKVFMGKTSSSDIKKSLNL